MHFIVRSYETADRPAMRVIDGADEFARPDLLCRHPRMSEYYADQASMYYEFEPESTFVAEVEGQVVGTTCRTGAV